MEVIKTRRVRITPFLVYAVCAKCKTGNMEIQPHDNAFLNPIRFLYHRCNAEGCGHEEVFDRKYPYIDYEPVTE